MEESFLRFDHLPEQIFKKLDDKSLVNSRVVRASWCNFIDARDYPWKRFQESINDLTEECIDGETVFHLVSRKGQVAVAEKIMKNSAKLNIDLNAKDNVGMTAFHLACKEGQSKIAGMIMKNSVELNIALTARTNLGNTGFQLAKLMGKTDVVNLIKSEMPNIV